MLTEIQLLKPEEKETDLFFKMSSSDEAWKQLEGMGLTNQIIKDRITNRGN